MKKSTTPNSGFRHTGSRQPRPENKDDLDSRKNEEQNFEGNDITHNTKERKTKK